MSVFQWLVSFFVARVFGFSITEINNTSILAAMMQFITALEVKDYTVYYISTDKCKRQSDMGSKTFYTDSVFGGLLDNLNYTFSLSVTYERNGNEYEGERIQPIPLHNCKTINYLIFREKTILAMTF